MRGEARGTDHHLAVLPVSPGRKRVESVARFSAAAITLPRQDAKGSFAQSRSEGYKTKPAGITNWHKNPALRLAGRLMLALALPVAGWPAFADAGPDSDPEKIYRLATNQFEQVILLKPAPTTNEHLAAKLAPLILQESAGRHFTNWAKDLPASLPGAAGRRLPEKATLYYREKDLEIGGRRHRQVTYWWFYPPVAATDGRESAALPVQGLRITLNSQEQPVIWEVLANETPPRLIYVAGSLEHAAQQQHGRPVAGRRFAADAGGPHFSVVARVIEDGPVVFGPIVYLRAGTRAPSTLICRCMPSQAREVLENIPYALEPLPEDWRDLLSGAFDRPTLKAVETKLRDFDRQDIRARLRLPDAF